jgi:hypothetical protein
MAKIKQLGKIETILINLEESLVLAKDEYLVVPSNPLYSIITDLELTIMEINKLKK